MSSVPNVDHDLEVAMAAEAVYAHERYLAFGVAPTDFSSPQLQSIVDAAGKAWEADGLVNLETVGKALQRAGKLAALGGADGLANLLVSSAIPDPERFVELRRLRMVREAALRVVAATERGDLTGALSSLGEAQTGAIDSVSAAKAIDGVALGEQLLESLSKKTRADALVYPGLPLLQRAMGDMPCPSMMVLGGGTNVGKSSVVLEMLIGTASGYVCHDEHGGRPVQVPGVACGYVSCEDPESVLSSRLLSTVSGVSSRKLAMGTIAREEWQRLAQSYDPLSKFGRNLWFSFAVGGSEIDVCAAMSRLAMRGCKLIVVDYVQAIECSKRQQDRRNEIRYLCARVKAHATRLGVALVLVSQLSRPGKDDVGREPTKHDLKEAGDLENAAEFVVLLWRQSEDDFSAVNVKLAKSKFGNIGTRWQMERAGENARLREIEESYESAAKRRNEGKQ